MTRVVFVTPNQGRQAEVQRLLADVHVELSRLGPAVPDGLDFEASARARAAAAFEQLGRTCFVENTAFELEDEPPLRGAAFKQRFAALGEAAFCREQAGRRCVARVVVALAEAPGAAGVRVFAGEIHGAFAGAPRGEGGYGWDRVFVPDGYERTLAELGTGKYLVNMRHAPYLDLADHLRGRSFGGAFEAHVTVKLIAAADAPRFRAACDRLEVKCVMIELPEGDHAAQPMTASVHRGTLREVQDEVHALARELVAGGFEVVRTKIEAVGRNADIPETEEQAARSPAGYFEYHVKLVVPAGEAAAATLARIAGACEPHGARLSRNANKRRPDGAEERFVTMRVPHLGRVRAEERFTALVAALGALDVPLRARIREYTVYDSNVGLDRGWL